MSYTTETAEQVSALSSDKYKYGFVTDIESDLAPKGLNEDIVRFISAKKDEPDWLLQWRLRSYRRWLEMEEPTWGNVNYPDIDFQDAHYYAAPKSKEDGPKAWTKSIPNFCVLTRNSASPYKSRKCWPEWRWMQCSTVSP